MSAADAVASATLRTCRWPIGEPKSPDFRFCAEPKALTKPYCEKHMKRAYRKVKLADLSELACNVG